MQKKVLLNASQIDIIINRLVCQLIENHNDFSNTVLIGLQPRGIHLLDKLLNVFSQNHSDIEITSGNLDYSFFRDDFRRNEKTIKVKPSNIDISIENKKLVLIDDVLFTGRSIRAAMSSIDSYGRPESIELMVLIDRRFKRELPIEANYFGAKIDTIDGDKVSVVWGNNKVDNVVYIEK
ncbi:MAG: bifunctional pyr operon transcriptional regulator/uracil phosphoribosyltransferase PyrR [Bacteroidota bacterium]|nr:bifunctional pyr operon transcriptional regulator/uracil phosphoribosyltransferase PyrR [Bacteroidota bacterium]|tara:strand:+ start:54 stop:590 length:537 start_codon:yes stop_codon:yes gene_type:complete